MLGLLVLTTTLEAGGDAIVRAGLYNAPAGARPLVLAVGAATLFAYGVTLNLAPVEWGRLIGAYVATFFVTAQIINLIAFRTSPSLPIIVGGALIVAGGAVITLWQRPA